MTRFILALGRGKRKRSGYKSSTPGRHQRWRPNQKLRKLEMEDRISTLPSSIIELILMCLPIAEAVRTSILSSRWRYQWCTTPHLIFDKQTISSTSKYKLESVVDQVLLLHTGPIHKFVFDAYCGIKDIAPVDRWLVFLSRNYLKELALKFCAGSLYKLPTVLYSCQAIVSLDLHDCEFKLPRNFNGFGCLTTLLLENISISEIDFASLISKCPLLRTLVFIDFYCCCHLKLNAPKLQELVVEGVFADIHLENTPDLASLSLGLEDEDEELDNEEEDFENGDTDNEEECYFNKCLSNIPKIERLELQQNFLDFMTRGHAFVRFPTYSCLKKVFLSCFNFEDLKHVMALQSLLQNTPVLKELELEADSDESIATIPTSSFFDRKESRSFKLDELRIVRLTELVGVRTEVEFIEFILSTASRLESLIIKLDREAPEEVKLYKEIMRFRRSSTRAEIVILDNCHKLATDDRISTLPSNIIDLILMCLPIAEAVRTSILSTRWRYQWCTIPHLIFNKRTFSSTSKYKLESIVDHVLLLHIGLIHRWLIFLSRKYVKELSLKFWSVHQYKLPLAFYFCHAIVSLDLSDCKFKVPHGFNGFNCLTTLLLENISILPVDFASLVSKCPLLRKLVFIGCYRHFHLKVNAPMLQELVVEGVFADIHLEHTPDLVSLSLRLKNDDGGFDSDSEDEDMYCFTSCLSNIPKIERLELQQNSLNLVTRWDAFVQFPTYSCLKEVLLSQFKFVDPKHVMALDSLLQNAPVLKKLELEAESDVRNTTAPLSSFFDRKKNPNFNCDGLRIVRLSGFMGILYEVEFIQFILFSASKLESLIIKLELEALEKVKLFKKILGFRRSSARAEIIILD
ncbi:uncharacterized protein LOC110028609 [Phalaenopsis equestris]|uniref:uncharacterized protein LOC110028609 n=1 Tax=Phalaenopsis equestris TaxID=78828 RepID=UPI0009E580AE|nr:uncharacterized protein LOC110028609 [Phalaenopsis equestris]